MFHLCLLLLALLPQEVDRPLPDKTGFLEAFRNHLHTPNKLLSQYTYTEKETERKRDSKGNVTWSETNVYQVINGAEDWQSYRRHISKNGVPLSEKELEKQDRKERERVEKEQRRRVGWSEAKKEQEKAKSEREEREEREETDDIFATFNYELVRRELIDGVSTILVNFTPKKNYGPKTRDAKQLQHVSGRIWISEDDHELVKLQAEVMEPIKIGAGLLAKVQEGSTLAFELRKINDEIWLPVKGEMSLSGKLFLVKGWNVEVSVEFSEHKKFNVDTILDVAKPVERDDLR